jgi:hypothetical protein
MNSFPLRTWIFFAGAVLMACGGDTASDAGDSDAVVIDADPNAIDADPNVVDANTTPCGDTQCNNCLDDDGDGQVDGADIECTGAADDDEGSFATDIPGDNQDSYTQDCFYDGNSGGNPGNDCIRHTCCFSDATNQDECDAFLEAIGVGAGGPNFDPAECDVAVSDGCIEHCDAVTPPGCDCFGCCTVCDPTTDECFDINTNPIVAPDCDADAIGDPDLCPRCDKVAACGTECEIENCVLCPGQTEADLPPECKVAACPDGLTACDTSADCASGDYCSNGCCIAQID